MESASGTETTARRSTSQNRAILSLSAPLTGRSERQMMASGWMPMLRRAATLCWVGLLLNSSEASIKGTSVTWT